jgi:hypothetical protein
MVIIMITNQELRNARNQAIRELDAVFAELMRQLEDPVPRSATETVENYDSIYPITFNGAEFKGKKPTSVIFGREKVAVYTWRMVFEKVMKRCDEDPDKHKALMDPRGKISGKARGILSDRPDGMRAPMEIAHKLYSETHYDTGTLLHILPYRILDPAQYDYSNIFVAILSDAR